MIHLSVCLPAAGVFSRVAVFLQDSGEPQQAVFLQQVELRR